MRTSRSSTGWLLCLVVAIAGSSARAGEGSLGPGDGWLRALPTELDPAFAHVARKVRFEPYRGVLRGARGTAISGAGNSWDKAALLAELLRRGGYEVRFVEGELSDPNVGVLLRGTFPPRFVDPKLGAEYAPYDPATDARLREAVKAHVWLEVNQGAGSWLPVDPSFPRAKLGEAYAAPVRTFAKPPRSELHELFVVWKERAKGTVRDVGKLELVSSEVGLLPVTLTVNGAPLEAKASQAQRSGGVAGMFGKALGGGEDEKSEEKPAQAAKQVGILLKRQLQIGDHPLEAGSTVIKLDDPSSRPDQEWLELTLVGPGRAPTMIRRTLFDGRGGAIPDALFLSQRRYSLGIFPGAVPLAVLDEQLKLARRLPLDKWRDEAEDLAADPASARKVEAIDRKLGPVPGYLLTLAHAQASDALSDQLAATSGVVVVRDQPRVLIAALETTADAKPQQTVSLDLRIDDVRAVPLPGQPARAAELFLRGRGMMSSTLEGRVVAQATGRDPATTSALMAAARAQNVPLVAIGSTRDASQVELTPGASDLVYAALRAGRPVIAPQKPLLVAGKPRSGFWELDPQTGAAVGVMDDGLHQAMVEYTLDLEEIGLNENMGKGVGAIVGAITVTGMLSAKILEHGELNEKVLEEVKKLAEDVLCYSCPKASASAGGSVGIGDDCFKWEKSVKGGVGAKIGFCEGYETGFKCSMALLLSSLEKKKKSGFELSSELSGSAELSCKKWPEEGK